MGTANFAISPRQEQVRVVEFSAVKLRWNNLTKGRSVVAVMLMFWCAGAGCLMVSYARAAMAEADAAAATAEQAMSGASTAMDSHACCKAKHKALERTRAARKSTKVELTQFALPSPARGAAMNCCPLTSGSVVVASRSQSNESGSELAPTDSSSLDLISSYQTPVAVPIRRPNRSHSYLLDCAFLI